MLTLSRKINQKILIGDEIVIEVRHIQRGQVRLTIRAPIEVSVDREEVRRRREADNGQCPGT